MGQQSEDEALKALYGPTTPYSDHKRGEHIRYFADGRERSGTILWVCAPGQVVQGGAVHPTHYIVDSGNGFPDIVYPGEIIM